MLVVQRDKLRPARKKFEILLDSNELKWFYMSCTAALPQLDRGSDYESERHRFESYTPHQLNFKASGNGGFSYIAMRRRSHQVVKMSKNQIQ